MFSRSLVKIGLTAILCLMPFWATAEVAIPPLQQRVTDLTQTLSPSDQQALEQRLKGLEQRSGAQVAILMVPTTQPEDTFSFGMRVVENWKLGRKGKDDGVLILLAKNDRKNQILVGYGLEGQLPDVVAKRILDDEARPYFKNGDFSGGLNAIVSAVAYRIEGKITEASSTVGQRHTLNDRHAFSERDRIFNQAFWIAVPIFLFGQLLRFMIGPMKAAVTCSTLGLFIITYSLGTLAVGLVSAIALFVIVLFFRFSWLWLLLLSSGSGGSSRGGGGGGFSGGGGSFGGGGSSGSW